MIFDQHLNLKLPSLPSQRSGHMASMATAPSQVQDMVVEAIGL